MACNSYKQLGRVTLTNIRVLLLQGTVLMTAPHKFEKFVLAEIVLKYTLNCVLDLNDLINSHFQCSVERSIIPLIYY